MAVKGGTPFSIPYDPLNFDSVAFNNFISANGVAFDHYKAVLCPLGKVDDGMRSPHHPPGHCSNGYIYKFAGVVTASFTNNAVTTQLSDIGLLDGSVVQVTFPQKYDDSDKQVIVQTFDRFYIKDLAIVVPTSQLVEAHVTGTDRLNFKAEYVEYLMDSRGNEYFEGSDFQVMDGSIVWTGSNRPLFDADLNKGTMYSVRYAYTPFFYVSRLMHEVRIFHTTDFMTNARKVVRAPYAAFLSREKYLLKEERGPNPDDNGPRSLMAPSDSFFGPK